MREDPIPPLLLGISFLSRMSPHSRPYTSRHLVVRTVVKRHARNNSEVHSKAIQYEQWQLSLSQHYCKFRILDDCSRDFPSCAN
jgi:hypothetical protein